MPGGQIQNLPEGWIWMYDGEEEWTTSQNRQSTVRHAYNRNTGERISVRQVRNIQEAVKKQQGLDKPKSTYSTREGLVYSRRGNHDFWGETREYRFRTLEELILFYNSGGVDEKFQHLTIRIKFKKSKIPGKEYDTYKNGKKISGRYASLSSFFFADEGPSEEEWESIYEQSGNFEYDKNSRFILFATET